MTELLVASHRDLFLQAPPRLLRLYIITRQQENYTLSPCVMEIPFQVLVGGQVQYETPRLICMPEAETRSKQARLDPSRIWSCVDHWRPPKYPKHDTVDMYFRYQTLLNQSAAETKARVRSILEISGNTERVQQAFDNARKWSFVLVMLPMHLSERGEKGVYCLLLPGTGHVFQVNNAQPICERLRPDLPTTNQMLQAHAWLPAETFPLFTPCIYSEQVEYSTVLKALQALRADTTWCRCLEHTEMVRIALQNLMPPPRYPCGWHSTASKVSTTCNLQTPLLKSIFQAEKTLLLQTEPVERRRKAAFAVLVAVMAYTLRQRLLSQTSRDEIDELGREPADQRRQLQSKEMKAKTTDAIVYITRKVKELSSIPISVETEQLFCLALEVD